jgi:preprotein translocase subunit YajC
MNFLISDAWAQAGGDAGGGLFSLLPLVVIFILFYFLLIRPQQKRAKQHKEMVNCAVHAAHAWGQLS